MHIHLSLTYHSLTSLTYHSPALKTRYSHPLFRLLVTTVLANAAESGRASSKLTTRNRLRHKRFLCRPHSVLSHQALLASRCPGSISTNTSFGTLSDYPGVLTYRVISQGRAEVCRCFCSFVSADLWPLDSNFLCSCPLNGKQEKLFREEVWLLWGSRTLPFYLPKNKRVKLSYSHPNR